MTLRKPNSGTQILAPNVGPLETRPARANKNNRIDKIVSVDVSFDSQQPPQNEVPNSTHRVSLNGRTKKTREKQTNTERTHYGIDRLKPRAVVPRVVRNRSFNSWRNRATTNQQTETDFGGGIKSLIL